MIYLKVPVFKAMKVPFWTSSGEKINIIAENLIFLSQKSELT